MGNELLVLALSIMAALIGFGPRGFRACVNLNGRASQISCTIEDKARKRAFALGLLPLKWPHAHLSTEAVLVVGMQRFVLVGSYGV